MILWGKWLKTVAQKSRWQCILFPKNDHFIFNFSKAKWTNHLWRYWTISACSNLCQWKRPSNELQFEHNMPSVDCDCNYIIHWTERFYTAAAVFDIEGPFYRRNFLCFQCAVPILMHFLWHWFHWMWSFSNESINDANPIRFFVARIKIFFSYSFDDSMRSSCEKWSSISMVEISRAQQIFSLSNQCCGFGISIFHLWSGVLHNELSEWLKYNCWVTDDDD